MMSFKIPCGGFRLDEESFSLDENGVLSVSGGGGGGVTTLHINVTAVNRETMEATFTADKTPAEMQEASVTGSIWCVVTFAAGVMGDSARSVGVPPAWRGADVVAFGGMTAFAHDATGDNETGYAVLAGIEGWHVDLRQFAG